MLYLAQVMEGGANITSKRIGNYNIWICMSNNGKGWLDKFDGFIAHRFRIFI